MPWVASAPSPSPHAAQGWLFFPPEPFRSPSHRATSCLGPESGGCHQTSPSTVLTHGLLLSFSLITLFTMERANMWKSRENVLNLYVPIPQVQVTDHFLFLFPLPGETVPCRLLEYLKAYALAGVASGGQGWVGGSGYRVPLPTCPLLFAVPHFSWTPRALPAATSSAGWWPGSTSASSTSQA